MLVSPLPLSFSGFIFCLIAHLQLLSFADSLRADCFMQKWTDQPGKKEKITNSLLLFLSTEALNYLRVRTYVL